MSVEATFIVIICTIYQHKLIFKMRMAAVVLKTSISHLY